LKPPCMTVVQYVLPAIRMVVAQELIEKHGLKQVDVAAKSISSITALFATHSFQPAGGKPLGVKLEKNN